MKILKIFGIVVGIHVFALVLIFANPGCSSTSKPPPAPSDTLARTDAPPPITVPTAAPATHEPVPPPVTFNPDAPATASTASASTGVRFTPTRPGTPAAGTLVAEPVVDVTPATTYTVKSGDSLWTIARKNHLTVAELAAANNIKPNANLRPSQKLLIPGKSASPSVAATPHPALPPAKVDAAPPPTRSSKELRHVVKSGETLGAIARTYGVPAREIAVANSIADPAKIQAGTELIIPGWESAGSKSGKSSAKSAKSTEPKAAPAPAEQSPATAPATTQPPPVPVIRIDDSPITPAPKN